MLVLSRRDGEKIIVKTSDGDVIIQVLYRTGYGQMKIGITAPESVAILRAELVEGKS